MLNQAVFFYTKMQAFYTTSADVGTLSVKEKLPFSSPNTPQTFTFLLDLSDYLTWSGQSLLTTFNQTTLTITNNSVVVGEAEYNRYIADSKNTYEINLDVGTYILDYKFSGTYKIDAGVDGYVKSTYSYLSVYINVIKNRLPLKKWTITDVINRCCETVEPLKLLEKPRFRLEGVEYNASGQVILPYTAGSQAEQLDKILSPEFVFTKMTLREMLQEIGGRIHGEPRVTNVDIINGKQYFTFKYDFYGQKTETRINRHRYVSASINHDVNDFCTKNFIIYALTTT